MQSTLSRFRTGSNFVSFFLGAIMAYLAPMELQTQIDELKAKVAQLEALLNGGNPKFGIITCVMDGKSLTRTARSGSMRRLTPMGMHTWCGMTRKARCGSLRRLSPMGKQA